MFVSLLVCKFEFNKMNKNIIFALFLFGSSSSVLAIPENYSSYKDHGFIWTERHPLLTKYILENRDHIKKFSGIAYERSKKYDDFIKEMTLKYNTPVELFVIPAVESAYRENAISSASAAGMWQFMKPTSKDWGLRVNGRVDERKDWRKSTEAGLKYLKWMAEDEFGGDYELAILAYNAGVGRVSRAIKKYKTRDPWVLITKKEFNTEQREYLPKFLAYMHQFNYLKKMEEGNSNAG